MILQFKIKNYRSYKEETTFSMEAGPSELKSENIAAITEDKQNFRFLKSAIIYGANASGKSNVIRAFFELRKLIIFKPSVEEKIILDQPFLFDVQHKNLPCEFELTFLGPKNIKFLYKIKIFNNVVLEEELNYYPQGKTAKVFSREKYVEKSLTQRGILGDGFGKKEIKVFENQLLLSKFGDDEPHDFITEVFLYFKFFEVINAASEKHAEYMRKEIYERLVKDEQLRKRLSRLIQMADTKINEVQISKKNSAREVTSSSNLFSIFGIHDLYDGEQIIDRQRMAFRNESIGTQSLYLLGCKILTTLDRGGVLVVDELDTSLHPFITKMIVMIFQSEKVNNKNAQLIFTTHDVSLLDRDLVRRDQIWFAEKDNRGSSDLYSLQDFEGLREDTPFEKWYLAGKFGGLPQLPSIESIFAINE